MTLHDLSPGAAVRFSLSPVGLSYVKIYCQINGDLYMRPNGHLAWDAGIRWSPYTVGDYECEWIG